jgi:hypothetical protein
MELATHCAIIDYGLVHTENARIRKMTLTRFFHIHFRPTCLALRDQPKIALCHEID